jgi:RNA polymerase sigma-70 factor (ECF subfamily)
LETIVKDIHQDLIEACRHQNRNAQIRIYELYFKALYNTSLRIVSNTAEAEDIMQESFLEAFRKIEDYRGDGSFGAWLKRIVVNNSINHLRKKHEMISLDESSIELKDPAPDEQEYSENVFCRLEEIREGIKKLPENYRILISLHLIEGYDHEEMAEIFNTTNGNIRVKYLRAKQKLLQKIMESRTSDRNVGIR